MGLFDKVNQVSRSVSESSKSAAETSNLKKKIAYEKERIQEVMTEIGRLFYENPNGDHKAELELMHSNKKSSIQNRSFRRIVCCLRKNRKGSPAQLFAGQNCPFLVI